MFSRLQLLAKLRELLSELLGFLGSEPELKTSRLLRANERGEQAPPISPLAMEAVKRTDALFDIERGINGESAEKRLAVRRDLSAPLVVDLEDWMRTCTAMPLASTLRISAPSSRRSPSTCAPAASSIGSRGIAAAEPSPSSIGASAKKAEKASPSGFSQASRLQSRSAIRSASQRMRCGNGVPSSYRGRAACSLHAAR